MDDIILYHGSRGGLVGDIKPSSRVLCDFGKGFYMGTDKMQAKALVSEKREPILYTLKFKLSEIPESRILVLEGQDWLNAVLAKRKLCEEFNRLPLAKKWRKEVEGYDVVIGKIADDKMLDAIERFTSYGMTDAALIQCLQSTNYGMQYVAKTDFACSKIAILAERTLQGAELQSAKEYARNARINAVHAVDDAIKSTRGKGMYLDEIVQAEQSKSKRLGKG